MNSFRVVLNHCCCTDFPLKITRGYRLWPAALIYSIKEVQAFNPGCFFWINRFWMLPITSLLSPMPSIILASSIFQRFSGLIALVAGTLSLGHYFLITLVVALLTCIESIRSCFFVLRIGFRYRKPVIHCFPSGIASPLAHRIRPAKALICL